MCVCICDMSTFSLIGVDEGKYIEVIEVHNSLMLQNLGHA